MKFDDLIAEKMSVTYAEDTVTWKYENPYDCYNREPSEEEISYILANDYYAVTRDNELVGFFSLGKDGQVPNDTYAYDDKFIDIGLGLKPEHCGKGQGRYLVELCIEVVKRDFLNSGIRLTVAAFNKRAITLYQKYGFKKLCSFFKKSPAGADREFWIMTNSDSPGR